MSTKKFSLQDIDPSLILPTSPEEKQIMPLLIAHEQMRSLVGVPAGVFCFDDGRFGATERIALLSSGRTMKVHFDMESRLFDYEQAQQRVEEGIRVMLDFTLRKQRKQATKERAKIAWNRKRRRAHSR